MDMHFLAVNHYHLSTILEHLTLVLLIQIALKIVIIYHLLLLLILIA